MHPQSTVTASPAAVANRAGRPWWTPPELGKLVLAIIICQIAGVIGALATAESVATWYPTLAKPPFSPPNWLFGPVWTTLYTLMGIALYLIWRAGASGQHNRQTLIWFTIQLVLNALWSFLFFGFQRLGLALVEIVLMWIAIVITIRAAFPLSRWAAVLLLPYLAWVTFATLLNASLWWLNRGQ